MRCRADNINQSHYRLNTFDTRYKGDTQTLLAAGTHYRHPYLSFVCLLKVCKVLTKLFTVQNIDLLVSLAQPIINYKETPLKFL